MEPIFLRHITPYVINSNSYNIKFETDSGNIELDSKTSISFSMYSHEWYNKLT